MKTSVQKRLAAQILKTSPKKVRLDPERADEIKEAITKADVKGLIAGGAIQRKPDRSTSRGRARKLHEQKRKGRRKGHGSRKGKATARQAKKEAWMARIRLQRKVLKSLKEANKITNETFKDLYRKAKGGFFRSKRHLKLHLEEKRE
ncbi:50S ribosomal protein L19e [Candidatus Woesearchaeota archaeon]|nr:MAG: 50S ribosomal protein L19e [Candidatus Woesearchaeota archaeon]